MTRSLTRRHILFPVLVTITSAACENSGERVSTAADCVHNVVFDSDRGQTSAVFLLDVLSRDVTQLTQANGSVVKGRLPEFEPGGQRLVFATADSGGMGHLFVVDVDGSNLRQLTTDEAMYHNPAWSPKREWITFEKGINSDWGLYLIRPDGSDLRRIGPEQENLFHPSWSPDGSRIAVVTGNDSGWVAGILDVDTGALKRITEPPPHVGSVKWSPVGSQLAIDAVDADHNFDLYLLDLDTNELRRLTINPAVDARPDWSPDGTQLVFHSTRDRGGSVGGQERWEEFELYILDLDSGTVERLTDNEWFDAHPDWCLPLAGAAG